MIENIYYLFKKVPNKFLFNKALPSNILEHINSKHLTNLNESLYAWNLLNQFSNLDLSKVEFLKSGKPILDGASISISHSKGYVSICYAHFPINLGIDIEKIENRSLNFLGRISKDFINKDINSQYKLWTEHEATAKALNLNLLNNTPSFKGLTRSILTIDGEFSFSIYNDSDVNLKEITYEN